MSAGPDLSGAEGQRLRLAGSANDPESTPTVAWSFTAGDDVDPGTTCSFENAHAESTTFSCTDDGTFLVTLTADDGVNAPVGDTARIRLRNLPPRPAITGPQPWSVHRAGTPVRLAAGFTDPGANDTHTCEVEWDDGASDSYAAARQACDRTHTFASAGMYTIKLTVTDDDGGSGAAEVMVVVYDPDAGFVTSGARIDSPTGALTGDPGHTGRGSFQFNPKYRPHDEARPRAGQSELPPRRNRFRPGRDRARMAGRHPARQGGCEGRGHRVRPDRVRLRPVRLRRPRQTAARGLAAQRRPGPRRHTDLRQPADRGVRPGRRSTSGRLRRKRASA
nr:hypothetical protein GCM10020093_058340 [Planobispora longispora]